MDSTRTTAQQSGEEPTPEPGTELDGERWEFPVGTIIDGRYAIVDKLGGGGMSVVYRCADTSGGDVAIKFLKPQYQGEEKWMMRFRQEAKAISRLEHPSIIRIHKFEIEHSPAYIVMDYIQGTSLADVVAQEGTMELVRTMRIMRQVVDGLQHAHGNGVVHRDLKPSNIMLVKVGGTELARILDFGIAKIIEPEQAGIKMTQTGEIFGSPAYMSPEQSLGKKVDERTDQYAAGCVLFECLTGCPPFMGDNAVDTLMKQIHYEAPTLKEASLGKTFPKEVEAFVARMLEKDPEKRYASMADVKKEITDILNPPSTLKKVVRDAKRTDWRTLRVGVLLGVAIGLIIGALVIYSSWLFGQATSKEMRLRNDVALPEKDERLREEDKFNWEFAAYVRQHPNETAIDLSNRPANNKTLWTISSLHKLTALCLADCRSITDEGLGALQNLPQLNALDLSFNRSITDQGVRRIVRIPKLKHLELAHTAITDRGVFLLGQMKDLDHLDLTDTYISDEGMRLLSHMRVNSLRLISEMRVTDKGYAALADAKGLHYLRLDSNPRLGVAISKFGTLVDLDELTIPQTAVRDSDLSVLLSMKHLNRLDLSDTAVSDDGLATIAQVRSLKNLKIVNVNSITAQGLAQLHKELPACAIEAANQETTLMQAGKQIESYVRSNTDPVESQFSWERFGR